MDDRRSIRSVGRRPNKFTDKKQRNKQNIRAWYYSKHREHILARRRGAIKRCRSCLEFFTREPYDGILCLTCRSLMDGDYDMDVLAAAFLHLQGLHRRQVFKVHVEC